MLATKEEKLITAGEFARLAQSTKKTIHWYTKHGIIRPKKINSKGYRFYSINQIIDLQVVMLLRKLNFSLPEIKKFLKQSASAKKLFLSKKTELIEEVAQLQKNINDISMFYTNLETDGVLIKPTIKTSPAFDAYYVEKTGPYSKILDYCHELKSYFSKLPRNATYFVLFPDRKYAPKKDRMRIGVAIQEGLELKKESEKEVTRETIPSFKTLSYQHVGSPALISMFIMQMHKYMEKKNLKQDLNVPINELEFYITSSLNSDVDINHWVSEINIPIL